MRDDPPVTVADVCRRLLVEGEDPTPGGVETAECRECGHEEVIGREYHGRDIPGFEETVQEVADIYAGSISGEEFREAVEEAAAEAFETVDEDELTSAVHADVTQYGGNA